MNSERLLSAIALRRRLHSEAELSNMEYNTKVKITVDQKSFYIRVPTIKEFSLNEAINSTYHM